ncbi:hypothetical protein ACF0H5_019769 [Mactra antiquata]
MSEYNLRSRQNSQPTSSTPKNLKEVYDITKRRTQELRKEFYSTLQQSYSNKSVQDNENNTPPKYDDTEVSKPRSIQNQSTLDEKPTAVIQTNNQYKEQPDLSSINNSSINTKNIYPRLEDLYPGYQELLNSNNNKVIEKTDSNFFREKVPTTPSTDNTRDLKLEESILISLIINGLNDQIKRQVILKEPKSLPDLSKFLKLCEVTNTLSVNVMETKFDKLLDEMQNLKIQMKETQEVSLLQPTDEYQQGYKQTSRDYVRSNRYTKSRNVYPNDSQYDNFAYKKPRTIRKFTVKPQLISHTQCCTKCGLDSCRFGKLCPAFNKACHVCGRMGHFRSQCFTGKK